MRGTADDSVDPGIGLRAQVLGGIRLSVDGRPVPVRGAQRRLLVGLLLAEAGRPVSVERIAETLWERQSSATDPANAVHAHLARLRKLLGHESGHGCDWLRSTPEGYSAHPDSFDLADYEEMVLAVQAAATADAATALQLASRARAMWGRPWGELADTTALTGVVRRVELGHLGLEEQWATLVVALGHGYDHGDEIVRLARAHPTREHRWSLAMRALVQARRQAAALELYDEARRTLADELGIDPGPDLQATHQAVLRQDPALLRPVRRAATVPLSGHGTPFVGRVDELAELDLLVARSRVVSVVGLGGLGKSTLVAEWLRTRGREGSARWVDLRGVAGDGVLGRVATELSLAPAEEGAEHALEVVRSALREAPTLLVIDNADLAGVAIAEVVALLVADVDGLTVLVTGRQPLGLSEERVLTLVPLPQPPPGESLEGTAVELALDLLGAEASEAQARAVATAAGGLPVAIEMLAARERAVPASVSSASATTGPTTDPVSTAVQEAVLHLSEEAAALFRRTVHLPGGMSHQLAEVMSTVAAHPPEAVDRPAAVARRSRVLRELVSSSLLVTTAGDHGMRYRALQPVVDARSLWSSPADVRTTMFALHRWLQGLMRASYFEIPQPQALRAAVAEWINLEELLRWCAQNDAGALLDLSVALADVWEVTGRGLEGHRWVSAAMSTLEVSQQIDPERRARALVSLQGSRGLAWIAAHGHLLREAVALLEEAGARGTDIWGAAHAQLAVVDGWRGDLAAMERCVAEAQAVGRRAGSEWYDALMTELDGMACLPRGRPLDGMSLCLEAATRFESLGDINNASNATYFACVTARFGRLDAPEMSRLLARAQERAAGTGMPKQQALIAGEVARFGIEQGRAEQADDLAAALTLTEQAGNLHHAAVGRRDLGFVLLADGQVAAATHQLRAATRHLLTYDRAACALAVAALASVHDGAARIALTQGAWALAAAAEGTPLSPDDRARITALAGPRPQRQPPLEPAVDAVREILDLARSVPPGPLLPSAPTSRVG